MAGNVCPQCGAPLDVGVTECKYCGEKFVTRSVPSTPTTPSAAQYQPPQQTMPSYVPPVQNQGPVPMQGESNKLVIWSWILFFLFPFAGVFVAYKGMKEYTDPKMKKSCQIAFWLSIVWCVLEIIIVAGG